MGQNQQLDLKFKEPQYLTEICELLYVQIYRNMKKLFSFFEYRPSNAWDFVKFELYNIFFPSWNILTMFLSMQLHF